jgi:CRP/FNR family transcriptional regulator, nitrogen fixation regulation protein
MEVSHANANRPQCFVQADRPSYPASATGWKPCVGGKYRACRRPHGVHPQCRDLRRRRAGRLRLQGHHWIRPDLFLADGRRQIGAFYMVGDVFGLEFGDEHTFSAEAISDAKVLVIKRSALVALAERDNEVARQLWALTGRELNRVQDHILLLIKTAQERVVGFLLEMAARASNNGALELPMSRQDIADYLGLTIETVSRTLTILENTAAIELPTSRRIVLRNRSALNRLNA